MCPLPKFLVILHLLGTNNIAIIANLGFKKYRFKFPLGKDSHILSFNIATYNVDVSTI